MTRFVLAFVLSLLATPVLAQTPAPTKPYSPPVIILTIGGGYDTIQHAQAQGEALVLRPHVGWSIGGGLGIHGDARIEGGVHLPTNFVDGLPRVTFGVTGFFVAPASPYDTPKSVTAAGAAFVIHLTPLVKISGEYIHSATAGFKSGFGWSAVFLLPLYTNAG